jgi:hypothetical protein
MTWDQDSPSLFIPDRDSRKSPSSWGIFGCGFCVPVIGCRQ